MRIALDITPISNTADSSHKVRGVGTYITKLKEQLEKVKDPNDYIFFTDDNIPNGTDLVHYPYFDPFFIHLPYRKKVKTVVTVHDLTPIKFSQYFPVGIKGRLKWEVNKRILKQVDHIITDSECSKKDVEKIVSIDSSHISSVYLGAEKTFRKLVLSDEEKSDIRTRLNIPEKFVLYVGDVTWNKNLVRLARAIFELNIPLVMAGKALTQKHVDENPWNKSLRSFNTLTKESDLFIKLGYVSDTDLVHLYNLANVCVIPSLYEGFGLPVLESMSSGCPVVTSKEGSLPEVAGDAAEYVDAYDIRSIVKGVQKVLENKDLQKELSKKGIEQSQKFSWEKCVQDTVDIYNRIK